MSKLKLKINVKVPQLLCIVVSVALNGEFERFGGFCVDCCYTLYNLDIPRYKFTLLRLLNILPYISLYFEHKQTHCLCGPPVIPQVMTGKITNQSNKHLVNQNIAKKLSEQIAEFIT